MPRPSSPDFTVGPPLAPAQATPLPGMPAPAAASPFAEGHALPAAAAKAGPTPLGLLKALKRRWVLATFIGLLVAASAAVAVWLVMPAGKHQAQALIRIRPPSAIGAPRVTEDPEAFRRGEMFLLRTRDLINRTLADAAVAGLESVKNADDAALMVEERLKIEVPAPDMLLVVLTGDNPDDMKVILEQLVRRHLDDATIQERRNREEQIRKHERTVERFRASILATENQIRRRAESGLANSGDANARSARIQELIVNLDAQVWNMEKEYQELTAQVEMLRKKLTAKNFDVTTIDVQHFVDLHPKVRELINQRFELDLAYKKAQADAASPDAYTVKELKTKLEHLDQQIKTTRVAVEPEVKRDVATHAKELFEKQLTDLANRRDAIKASLEFHRDYRKKFNDRVAQGAVDAVEMEALKKDLEPMKEFLAKTQSQLLQLELEKQEEPRVALQGVVEIKKNANLKQKTLIAVGASVSAFLAALVIIAFLEWRTRRIDSVDQVITDLGIRVIGTVPAFPNRASLKAAEVAGNANWRFVLNESINSTRTMLLHTARHQSMQVVMVTSATQGEGKTSLASQLGTSMAAAGLRTLIIDCDLRNPSIHKLFDLSLTAGVSEVLCQEADVSDAIQPTTIANLWVIPAGQCSTRVITALAQGHPLETLFNRLRGQFDFIIVDCCPVLPVADALLIGQHVDGVLFSIMQDISQLPKVLTASERLAQLNIPLVGAVVNGIRQSTYSYGYNYVKQLPA